MCISTTQNCQLYIPPPFFFLQIFQPNKCHSSTVHYHSAEPAPTTDLSCRLTSVAAKRNGTRLHGDPTLLLVLAAVHVSELERMKEGSEEGRKEGKEGGGGREGDRGREGGG